MTTEIEDDLEALRMLFAFGIPGGRTKIQKQIGKYLDGADKSALDATPAIKKHIDAAVTAVKARNASTDACENPED